MVDLCPNCELTLSGAYDTRVTKFRRFQEDVISQTFPFIGQALFRRYARLQGVLCTSAAVWLTLNILVSHTFPMARIGTKTISSRKLWLFGLLIASILVFQTSSIIHVVDVAVHTVDSDCDICDLLASATDDSNYIPVATSTLDYANALPVFASLEIAVGNNPTSTHRIRAPPHFI